MNNNQTKVDLNERYWTKQGSRSSWFKLFWIVISNQWQSFENLGYQVEIVNLYVCISILNIWACSQVFDFGMGNGD